MPAARNVIRDVWLEPGTVIQDREWAKTTFHKIHARRSADLALRPRLERLTFTDVKLEWSPADASVLTDIRVHNIRKDDSSMFFTGCTYDRVAFSGDCGTTIFDPSLLIGGDLNEIYREATLQHDRDSRVFSIDISDARGNFEVRGYRAARMIINPELHAIVRRDDVLGRDVSWLDADYSSFAFPIKRVLERGGEDALLCAYPKSKYFDAQLAAIARLRADGIADTVAPNTYAGR
ncbi:MULTISPECIES: hypothetical protein [Curtobacterium]|uniref:hypothetical protein n=1 Tax=Curtobacterium TaxID=2034 RepID=UPI0012DF1AAF|nr:MULTISPECIES: hypothetical protein [Curtobacterium]MCE0456317.1 hypothetical protein [Curtobacterium allii]MCS5521302.1 hypothetical protein [Curtobacterium flaccumfaciens pv. oortii]